MLYYFLVPLAKDHIVFNVFRYLTFRSFMALTSAFSIAVVVGPWLIRRLRVLQHGGETIREDTPERHRTKKGTPTMGGIVILTAIIATTLLWANLGNRYVWVVILATAGFGLIGVWDDMTKLRTRKGLPMRVKLGAQLVLAFAVLQLVYWQAPSAWLAVLTKAELLLPLIGGLYVVEALSVIIQVASFKLTGRRVFRMAPLHHHYELSGWPEPKIVVRFWIVSFALALLALTTLKLR